MADQGVLHEPDVHQAGHLLGIAVRHVKVDPVKLTPNIKDMRRACDSNTIMLLASAPQVNTVHLDTLSIPFLSMAME